MLFVKIIKKKKINSRGVSWMSPPVYFCNISSSCKWTISKLSSLVFQHNVCCHSQVCYQETERVKGPVNRVIHWWIWDFFYNLSDLNMTTSKIKMFWSGKLSLFICLSPKIISKVVCHFIILVINETRCAFFISPCYLE